ncbi:MAG: hypothetical protein HQL58_02085 [Magnetococcales bacterium]|nr:hypothetical protein [Magnetococcales bacterium]
MVMMSWPFWFLLLALCSTVFIGLPLLRPALRNSPDTGQQDSSVTEMEHRRDQLLRQLQELEQDLLDGLMTKAEADVIRVSLECDIAPLLGQLDQLRQSNQASGTVQPQSSIPSLAQQPKRWLAVGLMVLVAMASLLLYLPLRSSEPDPLSRIHTMVDRLQQRLNQQPDDADGWLRLARSYQVLEQPEHAARAYQQLSKLPSADGSHRVAAAVGLSELDLQSDDTTRWRLAVQRLETLLPQHADQPELLWVLGAAAARTQQWHRARELWQSLRQQLPPDSPSRAVVDQALSDLPAAIP